MGASLYGLLRLEATLARRMIGKADGEPPDSTGWYGLGRPGPAVEIVLLGDSSAAGYGVESVQDTPGAHLASGVADSTDRQVHLRSFSFVGAQTRDLDRQIDGALSEEAHVAVILVGVNDVTHSRRPAESVRLLEAAVGRLLRSGPVPSLRRGLREPGLRTAPVGARGTRRRPGGGPGAGARARGRDPAGDRGGSRGRARPRHGGGRNGDRWRHPRQPRPVGAAASSPSAARAGGGGSPDGRGRARGGSLTLERRAPPVRGPGAPLLCRVNQLSPRRIASIRRSSM
jgi:lysophospholipase L1-like esterase